MDIHPRLIAAIRKHVVRVLAEQPPYLRQGIVESHDATARRVTLVWGGVRGDGTAAGTIPGVPYIAAYVPAAGETVMVLVSGSDHLVLGKVA